MSTKPFVLDKPIEAGEIAWSAPSNIALVKYWGKHGIQLPKNPSVSLTLNNAKTTTRVSYEFNKLELSQTMPLEFIFHGERNQKFEVKVQRYFESLLERYPFLSQLKFKIESENNFPHSAGVASSASGMAALGLCLASLEAKLFAADNDNGSDFYQKASDLSRLGSGSAARSVYGGLVLWGKSAEIYGSSDEYAVQLKNVVTPFKDAIMLVHDGEKEVSSTVGHGLMDSNPYAETRYKEAQGNLSQLLKALMANDWSSAGEIIEAEALSLHGLMATSKPSFILMKPKTLEIIDALRNWRKESGVQAFFTLDAGPNVHILYKDSDAIKVEKWLKEKFSEFYDQQKIIFDEVGSGPVQL